LLQGPSPPALRSPSKIENETFAALMSVSRFGYCERPSVLYGMSPKSPIVYVAGPFPWPGDVGPVPGVGDAGEDRRRSGVEQSKTKRHAAQLPLWLGYWTPPRFRTRARRWVTSQ
jgi:hypothetical protein